MENQLEAKKNFESATFAGGCFWCLQPLYDSLDGVIETTVGYTGGHTQNPTYADVSTGETGHAEAILILFDPARISYRKLVDIFWQNIDPTVKEGQFCDLGHQYRSAIFYHDAMQKNIAEATKEKCLVSHAFERIETEILPTTKFYPAEQEHQNYYKKHPARYKVYHYMSGRENRLRDLWGEKGETP